MNNPQTSKQDIPCCGTSRIAMTLLCLCLSGCGKDRNIDWTQEVPLHDGRTLVVERHSELGAPFPGNSGMEIGQTLTFSHPDTGERITWKIPKGLNPAMIDFDQHVPYYVLDAYTVADYNDWGCPNPPYLVYRYQLGTWVHLPFEELPTLLANRNLISMSKNVKDLQEGQHVMADEMERYWSRVEHSKPKQEALKINREKVNPIAEGCHESVLIKQGRQSEIDKRR